MRICFPIRTSRDRFWKIDRWGRNLIDFCKKEGLLIMNGRLGGHFGKGVFTCYSGSCPSLIDYILCSLSLWPQAMDLRVVEVVGSDHFPVSLQLRGCIRRYERVKKRVYAWGKNTKTSLDSQGERRIG